MKPVINLDAPAFTVQAIDERFGSSMASAGPRIGAHLLGYRVTRLAPGKRAWPYHCHHGNEELFFILSGSGTLRYGEREYPLRQGDFVAAPPGGDKAARTLSRFGYRNPGVDYRDGEI